MIVILPGVRQYLIISLICISLIVRNIEHLSKSWLTISMSSLEKYLFRCSSHFLIRLFVWHWFVRVVHIFWKLICQFHCFQIFYPIPLVDLLFIVSFVVQKLLISFCLFLLLFLLPWETALRKYCYDLCQRMFCLCSLLGVLLYHVLYLGF